MTQSVLFDTLSCSNGRKIGLATLNKPEALNALNLDMVNLMLVQLSAWRDNPDIAAVMVDGRGDKAFCAGGDVVSMYHAMAEKNPSGEFNLSFQLHDIPKLLSDFFSQEYRLDYLIHTYSKPVVIWGNGIIMGGGLGLMNGASHRIVSPTCRIAMPEVSIGLYPDVGASWFLNRMPKGFGHFLGLTGANINAHDALFLQLADHIIEHDHKSALIQSMRACDWQDTLDDNNQLLTTICEQFQTPHTTQQSNLAAHQSLIESLEQQQSPEQYVQALTAIDTEQDSWLTKAIKSVDYGSPLTMRLVFEQMRRGQDLTLAECFKMELVMSCRSATFGEFQEGVRALLVDKDRTPKWCFDSVSAVSDELIESFFESPWPVGQHPLQGLEQLTS